MKGRVLRLDEVRAGDTAVAGGKGANLGELLAKGFPVPPGFVVSAPAYREVFDSLSLEDDLVRLEGASKDGIAPRCAAVHARVVRSEMPPALADAIRDAHARLVGGRGAEVSCAVRSSATAEDLAGASFAGQHGTYYYVDAERLLEMVRHCWASLWSPEAVAYRSTRGIPHRSVSMAVVVQEMVRSEVSGVAFTANPVSGDRAEIVIESSWGMGAALVDGRVTPDRYVLARDGLRFRERRIAEKRFMVPPRLPREAHERLTPVPQEMRCRETLRPDQVETVAAWSLRCEEHFGRPQDVEWAITDGQFHLLQSRPITALGGDAIGRGLEGKYVLFKAVAENFTDPLTPLTADLLGTTFPPGMRFVGGRLYFDLAHVRPLVPFRLSDEELADLLYLSAAPLSLRWSLLKVPLVALLSAFTYLALGVVLARTRGMPDDFMGSFRGLCRSIEADPRLGPLEALQRLWLLPRFLSPVGHMVLYVNVVAVRFAPWMATLRALLRRWLPGLGPDAVALLCSGSEGVLSAEMGRGIAALAREARAVELVADVLARHAPGDALERLREEPAARSFLARLDEFLATHGHRALKEFELQAPRWDETPAVVVGMIRNYLLCDSAPAAHAEAAARGREILEAEIRRALAGLALEGTLGLRWRLVRLAAERARYYFKLRENSRFYHIMALGSVRRKVLGIEAELLASGRLKCRDDVFFLRWGEVAALQGGRLGWLDVEDRIRERRIQHVRLAKVTPPRTIGIALRPLPPESEPAGGCRLVGRCASPGRYEGVARVILDPSVDAALHPGEVLVAPYTDPAWTPLFLTAGAAVVEVGSYLSHAGTVAREYGMPCVVDVTDCTRRIRTGDRVAVDADAGTVQILGGAPA